MTEEVKQAMKVYLIGMAWMLYMGVEPTVDPAKLDKMTIRLEKAEAFLKNNGFTEAQIQDLMDRATQFVSTPIHKMNRDQQLLMGKIVGGSKIEWKKEWGERYKHGPWDFRTYPKPKD